MDGLYLFPRTKLHPPRVHADVLPRTHLNTLIRRTLPTTRLLLISAPAGSGKTTLLTSALAAAGATVAWLRLDADDNDPMRFLHALLAAVARVAPDSVARAAALLGEGAGSDGRDPGGASRNALTLLLNDLPDNEPPLTLVLDDLHTITAPDVYALLDHALEQLPDNVTICVTTRHDPPLALARLRVRRELTALRLSDLRFTPSETTALLNEQLQLGLAASDVAALHARTEGWVAGLGLLAASLERITTPDERRSFLAHLAQTDRYVFDYLADEVLNRQDPFVRMFLLETAVLPDLTPARCAALTGRDDAAAILEDLERRNLFLVALDADDVPPTSDGRQLPAGLRPLPSAPHQAMYRYHDLFRAFLLARLQRDHPAWLAGLHRRAAAAEQDPTRRVAHLLSAQAWDDAAAAIVRSAPAIAAQGMYQLLQGWIAALPTGVRNTQAGLVYWLGVCAYQSFALGAARTYFERALAGFVATNDIPGEMMTLTRLAVTLHNLGDWGPSQALMARALELPLAPEQRAEVIATRAVQSLVAGNWQLSLADVHTLIDELERVASAQLAAAVLSVSTGAFSTLPGSTARLARLTRVLERLATDDQARMALLEVRVFYRLWGGHWNEALAAWDELRALGAQVGAPDWPYIRVGSLPAFYATVRDDRAGAEAAFATLLERLAHNPASASLLTVFYQVARARARWLLGDVEGLRADYHAIVALDAQHGLHPFVAVAQPLTRGLLAWAEEQYADAEAALRAVLAVQEQMRYTTVICDVRVLLGALQLQCGQPDAALATFTPALADDDADDAPGRLLWEGHIAAPLLRLAIAQGVHADFAARTLALLCELRPSLLATAPSPSDASSPAPRLLETGEALTEREIEVLHVLATGASNTEIAERLIISPHTAKRHVANLLAKLGATTRTEAAIRARDLGLI